MKKPICSFTMMETEQIFRGLQWHRKTGLIFTSCLTEVGRSVNGKIKWNKKK